MVNKKLLLSFVGLLVSANAFATKVSGLPSDLSLMEKGRTLFAEGKLDAATAVYSKVPVSSDFWLESIEERAWAKTRQGQYENALADLQSITSAVWSTQVGPETYMLSTFVSLKICAFKDVTKKINLFKQRMLPRIDALQTLVSQNNSQSLAEIAPAIRAGKVNMTTLGNRAEKFPRFFYRDTEVLSLVKAGKISEANSRLKVLAEADLNEIEANLKKMKIIEVELIQKVLMADNLKKKTKNLKFKSVNRDDNLVFPVNDDEVWIDEVGHYQVRAETCPYNGRKL